MMYSTAVVHFGVLSCFFFVVMDYNTQPNKELCRRFRGLGIRVMETGC